MGGAVDDVKEFLGYSGEEAQKNIVKDVYGGTTTAIYETLAKHAGDVERVVSRMGSGIAAAICCPQL